MIDEHGRTCTECCEYKLWDEFHLNSNSPHGRTTKCKTCKNKLAIHAHATSRFGINGDLYLQLRKKANGKCQFCGIQVAPEKLELDHCHHTGRLRGFLCKKCNRGLGCFNDDPLTLERAAEYIRNANVVL